MSKHNTPYQERMNVKELFETFAETEKLLMEAKQNLKKIAEGECGKHLQKAERLIKTCEEIDAGIVQNKVNILEALVRISILIRKDNYENVDDQKRRYWLIDGNRIKHSSPIANIVGGSSPLEFVRRSRGKRGPCDEPSPDFDAFCNAILQAAVEYLENNPQKKSSEIKKLLELVRKIEKDLENKKLQAV